MILIQLYIFISKKIVPDLIFLNLFTHPSWLLVYVYLLILRS
uniref:Uncharacterized protein n=1 Tax=viral metagenome TaxID=1070528 RepID=A0A6C0CW14_9ZZZZ